MGLISIELIVGIRATSIGASEEVERECPDPVRWATGSRNYVLAWRRLESTDDTVEEVFNWKVVMNVV